MRATTTITFPIFDKYKNQESLEQEIVLNHDSLVHLILNKKHID